MPTSRLQQVISQTVSHEGLFGMLQRFVFIPKKALMKNLLRYDVHTKQIQPSRQSFGN
jgi:hypothetical protein